MSYLVNITADPNHHVVWINMREEPIIYISRRPFVLREAEHPLNNIAIYRFHFPWF